MNGIFYVVLFVADKYSWKTKRLEHAVIRDDHKTCQHDKEVNSIAFYKPAMHKALH